MPKITSVNFKKGDLFEMDKAILTLSDGTSETITYFGDEISFSESELIGLTVQEARELKSKKDLAYLQR